MANSIDWGTLALGTVIGVGCQQQLKAAAKVTAGLAANLALATAEAVDAAAAEVNHQSQQAGNGNGGNQNGH